MITPEDEARIREIVREEMELKSAVTREQSEISLSMMKANTEFHVEKMLELTVPEDMRDEFRTFMKSVMDF